MSFLETIYLILWVIYPFGGGFYYYKGPNPNNLAFGAGVLVPWILFGILGWILFNGAREHATVVLPR